MNLRRTWKLHRHLINGYVGAVGAGSYLRAAFPYYAAPRQPHTVTLEFTNQCQLKCSMCPAQHVFPRPIGYMNEELFGKILRELRTLRVQRIRAVGGGEPTMHPRFSAMVREMVRVGPLVTVVTNGLLLDEAMSRDILQAGLHMIEISVESDAPGPYERTRHPGTFQTLIRNIQQLRRMRDALSAPTFIHIRLLVRPSDRERENQLVSFWHRLGDSITKNKVFGLVPGDEDVYDPPPAGVREPCAFPFLVAEIRWNGDVPLCSLSSLQTGSALGVVLGNMRDASLMEIWQGKTITAFRQALRQGQASDLRMCEGCSAAVQPLSHRFGLHRVFDPLLSATARPEAARVT